MLRSLIAFLLASTLLPLESSAVDNSSSAIPIDHQNSSKKQKIRFTAIVDTAIGVSVKGGEVFTPCFTYSRESLASLTDSSVIVVGFDSHWLIMCRNVKIISNESFFTLPEKIQFVVHSPARLGMLSYPAIIELSLYVTILDDNKIKLDLYPWF